MAEIAVITRKLDLVFATDIHEMLEKLSTHLEVKATLGLGDPVFVEYKGQAYIILPDDNKRRWITLE